MKEASSRPVLAVMISRCTPGTTPVKRTAVLEPGGMGITNLYRSMGLEHGGMGVQGVYVVC